MMFSPLSRYRHCFLHDKETVGGADQGINEKEERRLIQVTD